MRALLDINVLIALFDPDHTFHERAHTWWAAHATRGWASCPMSENGVVRIMSHSGYSQSARFVPADLIDRLRTFAEGTNHEFWPDDVSLRDPAVFSTDRIHSSRQLTDVYLLALAVRHKGQLATFDQGIARSAVSNADVRNLSIV